jgi:hypothetical protein
MPEVRDGVPCAPSRRTVLAVLGLAAAAVPLSACGIRLEDDAPRVPLIPTREPVPGEGLLLSLWLGAGDLAGQAAQLGGAATALPARLATLHEAQAEALRSLLRSVGVPDRVVAEAQGLHRAPATAPTTTGVPAPEGPTTAPAASPSGTPTGPTPASLGAAEAATLSADSFAELARLGRDIVVTPAAALAQRAAAATLLGERPLWPTPSSLVAPALAADALEASRAATYGMEVVAAQSQGSQRRLATTTLATLRARAATQEGLAGDSAPPASLGYPLPFAVTTSGAARRLAVHVLDGLRAHQAEAAAQAAGDVTSLVACLQWLAEAEVLCQRWGLEPEPFPGLR